MHEPKGRSISITPPRRFIMDLVHFAHKVPSVPVCRTMDIRRLVAARNEHPSRPSWSVLFMKAYALVAAAHAPLRRSLVTFPWSRFYEHPQTICSLAMERVYGGEEGVFVGLFRAPELQTIEQLQESLAWYQKTPLEEVGFFRQALRISRAPTPIRHLLWWSTLHVSGFKKAKRLGTFGLTSYGALGAESLHPISPLSTTMNYGPIDESGHVVVKLIYDHRILDGAFVARRLHDIEDTLTGAILDELRAGSARRPGRAIPPAA
jgi:hypothetical protein